MGRAFKDRHEAGAMLAERLGEFKDGEDVLVLALPRGGVVVGYAIASHLRVPLDVFVTRKLGFPGEPELAVGAVSETGAIVLNPTLAARASREYVHREIERQKEEIARRVGLYRRGKKLPLPTGKNIILVDDGLATGATAKAAVETLKREKPKELIVAVPVAPEDTALEFEQLADRFVCLVRDPQFYALAAYYDDFRQIGDEEVTDLLKKASQELKPKRILSALRRR